MQAEIAIGFAGLAFSIVGSAIGLGYKIGKVEQKLKSIDESLTSGTVRMDGHQDKIDRLDHRLTVLETRLT